MVVKIPKGSYHLTFEARAIEPQRQALSVPQGEALPPSVVVESVPARWRVAFILLLVGFLTSLVVLGSLLWNRQMSEPAIAASSAPPALVPLAAPLRPFASGQEEP